MCEYEICPTCGSSLDIGEKCTTCKPLVTPLPIKPDESYKAVNYKEVIENAQCIENEICMFR